MSDLSQCGRCGRRVVESALTRVGKKNVCPGCVPEAKREEDIVLAEAMRMAREAEAKKTPPPAVVEKAPDIPREKISTGLCWTCRKQVRSELLHNYGGDTTCEDCIAAKKEAHAVFERSLAAGDLTAVYNVLKETRESIGTIKGIMIFFVILAIINLIGGCVVAMHLGAFK